MFELIVANKDWLFSGIGIVVVGGIFNFVRNGIKERKSAQKTDGALISNQAATGNSVNIQGAGNGDISVGAINVTGRGVPEKIAKPNFSIKEVGFTGAAGGDPEYRLQLYNGGGHCYTVRVRSNAFSRKFEIAEIRRGGALSITVTIPPGTASMMLIIVGLDENGDEFSQVIHGTKYRTGYEFS